MTVGFSPARPPRASQPWESSLRGESAAKSSPWTRWPCTAAWMSARRSPPRARRAAVPHHLIDVIEPHEEYSLARYLAAAAGVAAEIRGRGRQPLFVGGTPLYLKGLLRGIFQGPAADWELRRQLEDETRRLGPKSLHRRLAQFDPAAAQRLHPNDTRRLIRAIEVFEKTGQPISRLQKQFDAGVDASGRRVFALDWPRGELAARIDRRVEAMFAAGLVEEVRRLLAGPHGLSRAARQAVGYREVIECLEGRRNLPETIELVKTHTRQLAKRQGTWFRSLSECRPAPLSEPLDPVRAAAQLAALGQEVDSGRPPLPLGED